MKYLAGIMVIGLMLAPGASALELHVGVGQPYATIEAAFADSFAYDEIDSGPAVHDGDHVWELRELKLYEVSIVTIGANQETEILAVKSIPTVAERALRDVKAGRVLSAKNEGELREAHNAIGRVLSALDSTSDEEKASGTGPSQKESEASDSTGASRNPSVDTSALDLLSLEIELSATTSEIGA